MGDPWRSADHCLGVSPDGIAICSAQICGVPGPTCHCRGHGQKTRPLRGRLFQRQGRISGIDVVSLLIWVMALLLGVVAYLRPGRLHVQGVRIAWKQIVSMVPRVVMAVMVSGFFSMIIPMDYVVNWIGRESGIRGILVASMVGGFTPGGPLICFPIVLVLYKTGAGIPQVMAFVTAWSVFPFHRLVSFDAPLM